MKILLLQLDGIRLPNVALMRLSAHHKALGHEVEFRCGGKPEAMFWDGFDKVYASVIFRATLPVVERLMQVYPGVIVGGTGVDPIRKGEVLRSSPAIQKAPTAIEFHGAHTEDQDYSLYPGFDKSIGFTQRGCRLKCPFCVVPYKEPKMVQVSTPYNVWRGDPYPRELLLLDNDFFGQPNWRQQVQELRDGKFKVSFTQGINARFLDDEAAEAIASLDYRDDSMERKRIYTAWDNLKDEKRLFDGLSRLVKYGVKPDNIMVYVLVGYWPGETPADREYRRKRLRDFGVRPYPMPFERTPELIGYQRFIIGNYDKPSRRWPEGIPWELWKENKYRPEGLGESVDQEAFAFDREAAL